VSEIVKREEILKESKINLQSFISILICKHFIMCAILQNNVYLRFLQPADSSLPSKENDFTEILQIRLPWYQLSLIDVYLVTGELCILNEATFEERKWSLWKVAWTIRRNSAWNYGEQLIRRDSAYIIISSPDKLITNLK